MDSSSPQEVRAAATSLREEALDAKLAGWRGRSIRRLLLPIDERRGDSSLDLAGAVGNRRLASSLAGALNADEPREADILAVLEGEGYEGDEARRLARILLEEREACVDERWVGSLLADLALSDERTAKARLREAMLIRDVGLANAYRKIDLLAERLLSLYLSLFLAIALIAPVVLLGSPDPNEALDPWLLALVALFGAIGASLSAILSLSRGSADRRVPEHFTQSKIMFFRPLFGAGAALGAYAAYLAGTQSISTDPAADPLGPILTLAFVAGFSESFVVKAVGAFGGQAQGSQ